MNSQIRNNDIIQQAKSASLADKDKITNHLSKDQDAGRVAPELQADALRSNQKMNEQAQRAGCVNPGEGCEAQREQLAQGAKLAQADQKFDQQAQLAQQQQQQCAQAQCAQQQCDKAQLGQQAQFGQQAAQAQLGQAAQAQQAQLGQAAQAQQAQLGQQAYQAQYGQAAQAQQAQQAAQAQQFSQDKQQSWNQQEQMRYQQDRLQSQPLASAYQKEGQEWKQQAQLADAKIAQQDQLSKQLDAERGGDDTQFKASLRQNLERAPHATEANTALSYDKMAAQDMKYDISYDKSAAALEKNQKLNEQAQKAGHINPGETASLQSRQLADNARIH